MAAISIPIKELTQFDLPAVCVVTGAREQVTFRKVQFVWIPPVARMAVFACGLIGVVAMLAMQKRVHGELPFTEEGWQRWRSGKILVAVGAVTCIGLVAIGAYTLSVASIGVGGLAMFTGVVALVAAALIAKGRGPTCKRIGDDDIELELPSAEAIAAFEVRLHGGASAPTAVTTSAAAADRVAADDAVYDRKLDDELRSL